MIQSTDVFCLTCVWQRAVDKDGVFSSMSDSWRHRDSGHRGVRAIFSGRTFIQLKTNDQLILCIVQIFKWVLVLTNSFMSGSYLSIWSLNRKSCFVVIKLASSYCKLGSFQSLLPYSMFSVSCQFSQISWVPYPSSFTAVYCSSALSS